MKQRIKEYSFIQVFAFFGILFLIIVLLLEFFYGLTQMSLEEALNGLSNPKYLLRKVVGALIYALVMTLYLKRKHKKEA